ncbi:MAG: hypothetical protein V3W37_02945 [Candidatus Binatia bacterium]
MITWNPLKLFRYYRAFNRLKEADMGKWNSRKLVVALLTTVFLWANAEGKLGLDEGSVNTLVLNVAVPALSAVYIFIQGLVDREEKKNGVKPPA